VDIREARIRRTDDTKERIKSLVAVYGNDVAKARYDMDVDVPDSESTAGLYEEVEHLVRVEDWVGEMEAVLEVWKFSNDKFAKRQRITIFTPVLRRTPSSKSVTLSRKSIGENLTILIRHQFSQLKVSYESRGSFERVLIRLIRHGLQN